MTLAFALLHSLSAANAATVAVLDFHSWGASQAETESTTEGVRAALLTEGRLVALPGSDIAAGVSATTETELRAARGHASEARRLYLAGDLQGAISAATAAVSEHTAALSQVGRRPELADAWFTLGAACSKSGLSSTAADAFEHVAQLYPRYLKERAANVSPPARALIAAAEAATGQSQVDRTDVAEVLHALDVDWVVTGSLDEGGGIEVQVWGPGGGQGGKGGEGGDGDQDVKLIAALHDYNLGSSDPTDTWRAIAAEIGKRTAASGPARADPGGTPDRAVVRSHDEPTAAARRSVDLPARRWWFWTGAAAVVGGGVLVGYALWEPAPAIVAGPDTWSVRIDGL
ncbi:MAG: hypothetical protein EXR69_05150 [Myxococcales bacterium]|nr:hypothetical protein [Myxococcales bacterium]